MILDSQINARLSIDVCRPGHLWTICPGIGQLTIAGIAMAQKSVNIGECLALCREMVCIYLNLYSHLARIIYLNKSEYLAVQTVVW
jgi:hypothetical protein